MKNWDVDVNNVVISKLLEIKNNYKYVIRYLNEVVRPLVLILPKIGGYDKNFKEKNN